MIIEEIQQKIEALANKIFEEKGMEVIELTVNGNKNDVRIQITADKSFGGINIEECAILNKSLVAAIEQGNFLPPETFSLELSSPGLDRPLVTRRDFMRCIGQKLHFWLKDPVGVSRKKEVQGVLDEVSEKDLIVNVPGSRLVLPLSSIIKGQLII